VLLQCLFQFLRPDRFGDLWVGAYRLFLSRVDILQFRDK